MVLLTANVTVSVTVMVRSLAVVAVVVATYVMRRSHSVQMFWPVGSPPVLGGFGVLMGALT